MNGSESHPRDEAYRAGKIAEQAMLALGCPRVLVEGNSSLFEGALRGPPQARYTLASCMLQGLREGAREWPDRLRGNSAIYARYVLMLRGLLLWVARSEAS